MKLDLVIFGATGFTGNLGTKYVDTMYADSGLKWGIAGRNRKKLELLQAQCDERNRPEVLVADGNDISALENMCKRTKVIATCAGPFGRYGRALVAACVRQGTDCTCFCALVFLLFFLLQVLFSNVLFVRDIQQKTVISLVKLILSAR